MKHVRTLGLTLVAVALAGVYGCGKKEEAKPAPAPKAEAPAKPEVVVKLGHVGPLTGPIAHLGKDNENGARMAVEDANAKGTEIDGKKIKFEFLGEDDQADPKTGTVVAQKLVDAKVVGVVGHLNSGTTIPASKIYTDAGIPQISPSATNPKYTQQGFKTTFRVIANDVQQGSALGEFSVKELKAKKIAIIDDKTAYGEGLANETQKAAEALGAKIVAREYTTDKATDFKAILTKIKGKQPDVIMYGGMDAQAGPMVKQMKELGIKAKFISGDGACTAEWTKLSAGANESHYCSQAGLPIDKMPNAKDFQERFTKKYGQIQVYAPYAYDATMALIAAMKKANSTDPAKYLPALATLSHDGVTAKVEFDEKGDTKHGLITIYDVKEGKLNALSIVGGAAAAPAPAAAPAAAAPAAAPKAEPKK
ncbi:MAG: branched-chain amino acid ABC transporter substrate-binding protein [Betaproteobacteria bacterium]|jgi:branched-chain amino acid transport system substrate-binding protein|nr:branched-chain amino acid ABC transporter substrate-binding protein [Betaproteobacteria bacterium]